MDLPTKNLITANIPRLPHYQVENPFPSHSTKKIHGSIIINQVGPKIGISDLVSLPANNQKGCKSSRGNI